jgi:hypothetical protein
MLQDMALLACSPHSWQHVPGVLLKAAVVLTFLKDELVVVVHIVWGDDLQSTGHA